MADAYTSSNFTGAKLDKLLDPINGDGLTVKVLQATFELAAADAAGDVKRVFRALHPDIIPLDIQIVTDGVAGATEVDCGLYETDLGPVVDIDCFMDGVDIHTAETTWRYNGSTYPYNGMAAVDIANCNRRLFEHAGHTMATRKRAYDLALTLVSEVSAAGTVSVRLYFAS